MFPWLHRSRDGSHRSILCKRYWCQSCNPHSSSRIVSLDLCWRMSQQGMVMEMATVWEWALNHLGKCCHCCCTSTNSHCSIQDSCQIRRGSCNPCWNNHPRQERNQGKCHQHHAQVAQELERNDQQSRCPHSCSRPGRPPRSPISSPKHICQACWAH